MPDVCVYVAARAEELRESHAALVAALRELGVKPVWSLIGEKLNTETAPLLMSAEGVLCFETHSTYHSAELTFALGDASWEGDGRPLRGRPLSVFAYADGDDDMTGWIWRDSRIVRLPTDPIAAARQLVAGLSSKRTI